MVLPVDSGTVSQATTYAPQQAPAAQPDPAQDAERILEVGHKDKFLGIFGGGDDYGARLQAYSQALQNGDANYRKALTDEILRRDPGAIDSWLDPGFINRSVADRTISSVERASIAENFAAAYNGHNPAFQTTPIGANPNGYTDAQVNFGPLDNLVTRYYTPSGLGAGYDAVDNAERARNFVDFINSSSGPEAAQFRKDYGQHLIDEYALNDQVDPTQRRAAAGIAAQLLGGDSLHPQTAADALAKYDDQQIGTFLRQASDANGLFGRDVLRVPAQDRNQNADDLALDDGVTRVAWSVALSSGANADKVALSIAKQAHDAPELFAKNGNPDYQARLDALGATTYFHSDAILDALTRYDRRDAGSPDDTSRQVYHDNAEALGALLRTTVFNTDGAYSGALKSTVLDYAKDLQNTINSANDADHTGFEDAADRLAMLSAASSDAISQGWQDIRKSQEAVKQTVGFVVDLALAALPADKWVGEGVKNAIAQVLPEGRIRDAIQGVTGKLVDERTGKLTDAAKDQLAAQLGPDTAAVIDQQSVQDGLEAALTGGIHDEVRRDSVVEKADRLTDDLGRRHDN